MLLREVTFRGLTRFLGEPIRIDYGSLGPGLVALVGRNGQGKTTAMEAVVGGLYKRLASRPGSLYDHAHGRDAFIELVFEDGGHELRVRLLIDAEKRTTEGYVTEDGAPITRGKAADFDLEIERRFGSMALFLSSVFAAQNKAGNFLLATKGERKQLFVELLGIGHLERLAGDARARRSDAETEVAQKRAVLTSMERELEILPGLETELADARTRAAELREALSIARDAEQVAAEHLEQARRAGAELEALVQAERAAHARVEAAQAELRRAQELEPAARRRADERRRSLSHSTPPEEMERRAEARATEARRSIAERRGRLEAQVAAAPDVEVVQTRLAQLEAESEALNAERDRLAELRHQAEAAEREAAAAEKRAGLARARHQVQLADLGRRASLIDRVPCAAAAEWSPLAPDDVPADPRGLPGAPLAAYPLSTACLLLADARSARQSLAELEAVTTLPEDLAAQEAVARWQGLARARTDAERNETSHTRSTAIQQGRAECHRQLAAAEACEQARQNLGALEAEEWSLAEWLSRELAEARATRERIEREGTAIEVDLAAELATAAERVSAATEQLGRALADHATAEEPLEAMREHLAHASIDDAELTLQRARIGAKTAEAELRTAEQRKTQLETQVGALELKAEQANDFRGEIDGVVVELGDWQLLDRALGKDGVQALEVDAAGPEVARLTNELLESCYGPRFTIAFETLREKRSAKGEYSEVFDVQVFDTGEQRPVEALSGGEKVVIGEAVGLSLAIFNSRKSGIRWRTLFRDETASALDPENAGRYIQMLRRALSLGGFEQVIYVAHLPELHEAADARVLFEDGKVRAA